MTGSDQDANDQGQPIKHVNGSVKTSPLKTDINSSLRFLSLFADKNELVCTDPITDVTYAKSDSVKEICKRVDKFGLISTGDIRYTTKQLDNHKFLTRKLTVPCNIQARLDEAVALGPPANYLGL